MAWRSRIRALVARVAHLERIVDYQPSRPVVVILDGARSPAERGEQLARAREANPEREVHVITISIKARPQESGQEGNDHVN